MHIRRCAADVHDHEVSNCAVKQLRSFHYRAGGGHDRAGHHVADVFHAGRFDDMLLEHLVDNAPRGLDVEKVKLGVYVLRNRAGQARAVKNSFDVRLILHVARIDDGRAEAGLRNAFSIEKRGFPFAVIRTARKENEVGLCLLQIHQVKFRKFACRCKLYNCSRAERCGLCGLNGHVVNKAAHAHAQPACRRACGEHLAVFKGIPALLCLHIGDCAAEACADIAFQHARWGLPLRDKARRIPTNAGKRVDQRGGGADFGHKNVNEHVVYLLRIGQ